ncbi:acyltransferase family protein [Micromonospora globbae]|uniref:acyltransferase family protein n=1 Tax=Micromonospora globbae TaxID=1894969 RepID=UPI003865746D|nr:acyltransferase [Micromonospora globbae]
MEPHGAIRRGGSDRLVVVDGLRLISALMVVLYHLLHGEGVRDRAWGAPTDQLFPGLVDVAAYGWLGVEMFFLISGFVICMSSWGRSLGEFAVARVVRLYPAYWFAVVVTTTVLALFPVFATHLDWTHVLVNMTMLQSLMGVPDVEQAYWTLPVELLFYVLFALVVVARGVTVRRVVAFCALWTLASLFAPLVDNTAVTILLGRTYAQYFIAGIAFYLMYRFGANALLWAIVGFSWIIAISRLWAELETYTTGEFLPAAACVTVFFVIMALIANGLSDRIRWRWLTTAGALTYPLYLLHEQIGLTVITAARPYVPAWVLLGATVAGLLVLAYLVHRLVERPAAKRLRRALLRSLDNLRAADATPASRAVRPPAPRAPEPGTADGPRVPEPRAAEHPGWAAETGHDAIAALPGEARAAGGPGDDDVDPRDARQRSSAGRR